MGNCLRRETGIEPNEDKKETKILEMNNIIENIVRRILKYLGKD